MKNLIPILLLCSIMVSCKKNDTTTGTTNSGATYKGILVGPGNSAYGHNTGAVVIKLPSSGTVATVYVNFVDGVTDSVNVIPTKSGIEQSLSVTVNTAVQGGIKIQFSTGADGKTPALSAKATDDGVTSTMTGFIIQETSAQPLAVFLTVGDPSNGVGNDITYSFIKSSNSIQGYERWGSYTTGTVNTSVTNGQFTNSVAITAAGKYKYTGTFNSSDSTVAGTFYSASDSSDNGTWRGWRVY